MLVQGSRPACDCEEVRCLNLEYILEGDLTRLANIKNSRFVLEVYNKI